MLLKSRGHEDGRGDDDYEHAIADGEYLAPSLVGSEVGVIGIAAGVGGGGEVGIFQRLEAKAGAEVFHYLPLGIA